MMLETVLNRIIATASFTMPSPNTKENSLGCSSYLIIVMAAMTSELHRSELMMKHSCRLRLITFCPLYYFTLGSYLLLGVHDEGLCLDEAVSESAENEECDNGSENAEE
jgi:hypothetical protein